MLFKNITIIDENIDIRGNMYIGIKDDKIDYISTEMPNKDYGQVYDGSGKVLMTAFFNCHAHSPMALMRGYGENMVLQDWLNKRIFPFEDHLDENATYWGTMLCLAESIKFGIASTSDMYMFCEDIARAYLDVGCKGNISRGIAAFKDEPLFETYRGKESMTLFENWHNAENGKIKVDMSIHAEYTSVPGIVRELADYAKKIGVGVQVHISETEKEHCECIERHGKTPTQYFAELGLFDVPVQAAHGVWLTSEDIDIFKEKNATVVCNIISNLKLSSGVCNIPALLNKGVNIALGTDSVASNNNLNFFEEIKMFSLVPKMHFKDPTVITPKQAIYAATTAGAKAQGREDCGKLAVGYKADLIVVDACSANMQPIHNLLNNVVYSIAPTDLIMTIVDGKVLYEKGEYKTLDIERITFEVDKATKDILNKL